MTRISARLPARPSKRIPVATSALGRNEDQFVVLAGWISETAPPAASLLDIGAGDGDDEYSSLIRPLVGRFAGVDPELDSARNPALDDSHPTTIEAFAARAEAGARSGGNPEPPSLFDIAIAVYVAEHVDDPYAFLSAARSCIVPGGSLFLITPHLWHYFGLTARTATALRFDDWLLEALRRRHLGHGRRLDGDGHTHNGHVHHADSAQAAHFPMSYRMNTVRGIRSAAEWAGFSALEVRLLENPAVFETYFPGRLVALPRAYSSLVHKLRLEAAFGTLICRLVN